MFMCALSLLWYNGENVECLMLNRRNQDQRKFLDIVKKKEHSKLFKVDGKKNKWSSHTRIAGEFSITRSLYQLYNDIYGGIKPIRVGVGIVVILT